MTIEGSERIPNEADLDKQYQRNPFPAFEEWSAVEPKDAALQAAECLAAIDVEAERRGDEALRRARDVTLRAAAVDTGSIEDLYETNYGITMSIARRVAGWQAEAEARSILPFFEAQLAAFEIVMDLVTENRPLASQGISEMAIKELHRAITRSQMHYEVQTPAGKQLQELPRGIYKRHANHVVAGTDGKPFAFAPVQDTEHEMQRFVDEVTRDEFLEASPLVQATYSHYALVRIHPFADGNGRVARAVSSIFLLRAFRVPLVVFDEDRPNYLEHIRQADDGDHQAFTDFVGTCVSEALQLTLDELRHGVEVPLEAEVRELNRLLLPDGELDHRSIDSAAKTLVNTLEAELEALIGREGHRFVATEFDLRRTQSMVYETGFRQLIEGKLENVVLAAVVQAPARISSQRCFSVQIPKEPEGDAPICLVLVGAGSKLQIEARSLLPVVSSSRRRIRRWLEREFALFVQSLRTKTETELKRNRIL